MAEKYTYADVIIDPDDPRVEIGKEYYYGECPKECIKNANDGAMTAEYIRAYEGMFDAFELNEMGDMISTSCLIRKKEPRYVPFDLNDPEVRKSLRGRWITDGDRKEGQITGFERDDEGIWHFMLGDSYLEPKYAVALWTFDDGTPCGFLKGDSND